MTTLDAATSRTSWRTPGVIIICGCLMAVLSFGPRSALGFFLTPMSEDNGWGRDVFSLALAVQNLLWGAAQPFAGAIADRYGALRVLAGGAIMYVLGLALMAHSQSPAMLELSAGVLLGFGLSGCSFNVVLAAFGKLLPEQWRSLAFGAGTAAGSFGQFLFSPLAVALKDAYGWQSALTIFAGLCLVMLPLSLALATARNVAAPGGAASQSLKQALSEALGHRSYMLLVLGFFTCGFQLAFITVHFPSYLVDRGLSANVGMMALALVGLFNIFGSFASGALGAKYTKKYLLSSIYFTRSIVIALFVFSPVTEGSVYLFSAAIGLLWLSTVPLTNGVIGGIFGVAYMSTLSGFVFLSHQIGSFTGVWLGGYLFDHTGSYRVVWLISIALGIFAALVNLPIQERAIVRAPAPRPAV